MNGKRQTIDLPSGSMAYTFCQVPVIYHAGVDEKIDILFADGTSRVVFGHMLGTEISQHVFRRDGQVSQVSVVCSL